MQTRVNTVVESVLRVQGRVVLPHELKCEGFGKKAEVSSEVLRMKLGSFEWRSSQLRTTLGQPRHRVCMAVSTSEAGNLEISRERPEARKLMALLHTHMFGFP